MTGIRKMPVAGDEAGPDAAADVKETYEIRERGDGSGEYEVYNKKEDSVASGWAIKTRQQAEKWITDLVKDREARAAAAEEAEANLARPAVQESIAAVKNVANQRPGWEEDDDGDASYMGFGYITFDGTGEILARWESGDLGGEETFTDAEEAAEWVEGAFNDPEGREDGSYS